MTEFNSCPNCQRKQDSGLVFSYPLTIYECRQCETVYCSKCGGERCPNCGKGDRKKVGEVARR